MRGDSSHNFVLSCLITTCRTYLSRAKLIIHSVVIAVAIILMAGCTYFLKAADGTTYRSPDGSMVAVVQQGVVSVNGQVQNPGFDGIYSEGVKFCPDGKRVGYVAIKKGKFHVIIDGRDSGPFDNLMSQTGLHFSPKCKHVAIPIVSGSKWHMWIDGELSVGYDAIVIGQVVFSDDENQFAYRAKRGEQWVVVSNRREVYASGFDLPAAPIGFLSTGQLYFFSFTSERKMQLHIGDSIGEQFQVLSGNGVKLSPDKRNLAFQILRDNSWFHCLNLVCHRPGPGYAYPGARLSDAEGWFGKTFWTHTGLNLALGAMAAAGGGGSYPILVGGGNKWIYYDDTVFSPDGQHYAYIGYDDGIKIYLDDVGIATMPESAYVEYLYFSDNSSVLVYRVSNSNRAFTVPVPGPQMIPKSSIDNQSLATLTIKSAVSSSKCNG